MSAIKALLACFMLVVSAVAGFAEGSWEDSPWDGGRELSLSHFFSVDTSDGIDVVIQQSDEYRVTLYAERDFAERIRVEKRHDELHISVRSPFPFFFLSGPHDRARVEITMPDLRYLRASGGAKATLHMDARGSKVAVELSGGGRVSGTLRCDTLSLGESGGSGSDLRGSADQLALHGSGGSVFDLGDFSVLDADVRLGGGSSARLTVEDDLSVSASGGSHVTFRGSPFVNHKTLSGGSWIRGE